MYRTITFAELPFAAQVAVHAKQSEDYKAPEKPKNAFEGAFRC
jgi:hypothetical protein